ncbi:MAG: hypothetical protein JSW11_12045 [Candidatus Heimdallarchaeota archaeon]|nr:MAG: hypothetical protein JSW11_12045 [Candidatus Heimdallarchaeota archaeon]
MTSIQKKECFLWISTNHFFVLSSSSYYTLFLLVGRNRDYTPTHAPEQLVQEYPQSSYAHFYLGTRYERLGKVNLAINNFKKAIEMEKKTQLPESEKLLVYRINLQDLEKKE